MNAWKNQNYAEINLFKTTEVIFAESYFKKLQQKVTVWNSFGFTSPSPSKKKKID